MNENYEAKDSEQEKKEILARLDEIFNEFAGEFGPAKYNEGYREDIMLRIKANLPERLWNIADEIRESFSQIHGKTEGISEFQKVDYEEEFKKIRKKIEELKEEKKSQEE